MVSRVASLSISVDAALVMELTSRAIKSVQAPCGSSIAPMAATHCAAIEGRDVSVPKHSKDWRENGSK